MNCPSRTYVGIPNLFQYFSIFNPLCICIPREYLMTRFTKSMSNNYSNGYSGKGISGTTKPSGNSNFLGTITCHLSVLIKLRGKTRKTRGKNPNLFYTATPKPDFCFPTTSLPHFVFR